MNFYATQKPSWTYEEIQAELEFLSAATTREDNGYDDWLSLWNRVNQLDDMRAASDEQRTAFDSYVAVIFNGMQQLQPH